MAAPATEPDPQIRLTTPGGVPASSISSHSRNAESVVSSAGFMTTVLPQASAGAILLAAIVKGAFHGLISPHTPMGSRSM